jgi:hypothetical protein
MTISATTQGIKPGVCTSTNRPVNPFDGQVIYMTDVDQTAVWDGSQWTVLAPIAGGRNVVINGAMQVAQRGTTFTGLTSFQYSLDRWKSFRLSGAPYNISQQATSDTTNLPNIQYCARVGRANSNTDLQLVFFSQSFESLNSRAFAGKIATVSFYARKGANYSAASSALKVELNTGTGTDQDVINGFTGQASPINQTATLTTTWQRFTYTSTTLSSSMTQLAINFYYTPVGTAGAADYFEITGVQVEAGSVPTPFEFEDYGTTLQKCLRYYEKGESAIFYQIVVNGTWVPWTERLVHYKVRKRSTGAVSVTVTGGDNAAAGNGTVQSFNVDSFSHKQTVNNASFPYCSYSMVYAVNSEL